METDKDTPFRYALASARRLYLHWTQDGGDPTGGGRFSLEKDFSRVIKEFEKAVDEIDSLNLQIESFKRAIAILSEVGND